MYLACSRMSSAAVVAYKEKAFRLCAFLSVIRFSKSFTWGLSNIDVIHPPPPPPHTHTQKRMLLNTQHHSTRTQNSSFLMSNLPLQCQLDICVVCLCRFSNIAQSTCSMCCWDTNITIQQLIFLLQFDKLNCNYFVRRWTSSVDRLTREDTVDWAEFVQILFLRDLADAHVRWKQKSEMHHEAQQSFFSIEIHTPLNTCHLQAKTTEQCKHLYVDTCRSYKMRYLTYHPSSKLPKSKL